MEKCKIYKKCGNCQLLDKDYPETIKIKQKYVQECFKKENLNLVINEIIPAKQTREYRNKMIISFGLQNNQVVSGFYEQNSHKIVDVENCLMHTPFQNTILKELKKIVKDLKIRIYDEDRRSGILRHILIKESFSTKEVMVVLVTSSLEFPGRNEFVKRIRKISNNITTIIQNVNNRKTSIVLGNTERILFGNGTISDKMLENTFLISSKTFYQINPYQTALLYQKIIEIAGFTLKCRVIDAYSGVGTIGIIIAKYVKEVISVENNPASTSLAIQNAKINKCKNIYFINDDATNFLVEQAKSKEHFDYIILDPPRSGSTKEFLEAIMHLKISNVIYVSCGPDSLARDLKILTKDYQVKKIVLVDLFVFTNHIETICHLVLKKE